MAALAAVLVAILRAAWRSLRAAGSVGGNNLLAVIVLMMAEEPRDRPSSTAIIYLMIGLLYTVPLALELHRRIPAARLQLWPLRPWQRIAIYALNLACNPLFLMAVVFAVLSRHPAVGTGIFLAGLVAPIAVIAVSPLHLRVAPSAMIPRFPGMLGGLIQSHVRELSHMLDFYFAVLLAIGGLFYRFFGQHPDPFAPLVIGHLLVILLSTLAQAHVAFDAEATSTRMRLLPITPLQILLAKDFAWLALVVILIAPYPWMPSLAAALTALAIGHSTIALKPVEQRRWHFSSGVIGPTGIFQILGVVLAGSTVHNFGILALLVVLAIYVGSLLWYAREAK